ncbi:MAG: HEPN domain-containing protein [Saprospiraceae bacterium]|nr:HEPN domain-containing protein [Saprospiraceae bacterium]
MKEETEKLLERAKECLEEARQLYDYDHYLGCVNRSYYCTFCAARALLIEHGQFVKTHQGLQNKFHQHFIKTGLIDRIHADNFRYIFDLRQAGDYEIDARINKGDATYALTAAQDFLEAIQQKLGG